MPFTNAHTHLVIMAGGIGSRFWPVSTPSCPKQFLDIMGTGQTMLQLTLARFGNLIPPENVWVLTGAAFADYVREQLPQIPFGNVLLEPCGRGTAPCICYAAWKIKSRDPQATLVVTPADHDVRDVVTFRQTIAESVQFASETDAIVTLGIQPTHPATGYGYIKADLGHSALRQRRIYRVDAFKEKPDIDTARQYISHNDYYWNSGIFVWSVPTIVNAFRIYCPEVSEVFESMAHLYDTPSEQTEIDARFPSCRNISVDYAILEHADEVFVYPVDFGWSDVGTWGALHAQLPHDAHGNAIVGKDVNMVESSDCIVHTTSCRTVVVQGLEGYIIVEHDGQLLIARMSEEQRIRSFHD